MKTNITVIDAPSNLGLRPPSPNHLPGVWQLPQALRRQGLLEQLGAEDGGAILPPAYSTAPDFHSGFRNGMKIADYSMVLAEAAASLVQRDRFPLILGGDCSISLGSMLALRSLGVYGLCYIDGHNDFAYPKGREKFGYYAAGGLALGLVTGYGPDELVNMYQLSPYVNPAHVVALGFYNDPADADDYETEAIYQTTIQRVEVDKIREIGAQEAAASTVRQFENSGVKGFWIHLDADVLDQSIMPAVDSPNPNGLGYAELVEILRTLLESDGCVGIEITIFDPELDPGDRYAAEFASAIVQSFGGRP